MDSEAVAAEARNLESLKRIHKLCPGAVYRHYKGGRYTLSRLALTESDLFVVVVYRPYGSDLAFVRPLLEWVGTVEHEGQTVPRYTLEGLNRGQTRLP